MLHACFVDRPQLGSKLGEWPVSSATTSGTAQQHTLSAMAHLSLTVGWLVRLALFLCHLISFSLPACWNMHTKASAGTGTQADAAAAQYAGGLAECGSGAAHRSSPPHAYSSPVGRNSGSHARPVDCLVPPEQLRQPRVHRHVVPVLVGEAGGLGWPVALCHSSTAGSSVRIFQTPSQPVRGDSQTLMSPMMQELILKISRRRRLRQSNGAEG